MALAGFTPSHGNVSFDEVDPYLAEAAGRLRQTWGADLPVNSAYRSPEYNAKVGGAQNSQHMHGTALDLNMAGMSPEDRARLLTAAMDAGFTSFGFYDKHPDMLHVDVREGGRTWGNAPAWAQPIMGQRFKRGMGRVQMAQADTGTMTDAPPSGRSSYFDDFLRKKGAGDKAGGAGGATQDRSAYFDSFLAKKGGAASPGGSRDEIMAEADRLGLVGSDGQISVSFGGEGSPDAAGDGRMSGGQSFEMSREDRQKTLVEALIASGAGTGPGSPVNPGLVRALMPPDAAAAQAQASPFGSGAFQLPPGAAEGMPVPDAQKAVSGPSATSAPLAGEAPGGTPGPTPGETAPGLDWGGTGSMSLEKRRAIAQAQARRRRAEAEGGAGSPEEPAAPVEIGGLADWERVGKAVPLLERLAERGTATPQERALLETLKTAQTVSDVFAKHGEKITPQQAQRISLAAKDKAGNALAAGAGDGWFFGFGDSVLAALRGYTSDDRTYEGELRRIRIAQDLLEAFNPGATIAGEVGGGVASGLVTGALAGAAGIGAGITTAGKVARAGIGGAGAGAAFGAGSADGENVGEEALKGAALGAAGGVIGREAGVVLGKLMRRLVGSPKYFDGNRLTDAGRKALSARGIDPATVSDDFAQRFAERVKQAGGATDEAVNMAIAEEFGIPLTRGQATGNVPQIAYEEAARNAARGRSALNTVSAIDSEARRKTGEAIDNIATGLGGADETALGAAERVTEGVRRAAGAARQAGRDSYARLDQATGGFSGRLVRDLDAAISTRLKGAVPPDATNANGALRVLRDTLGKAETEGRTFTAGEIEKVRQMLGRYRSAAYRGTNADDQIAMQEIVNGFDSWLDDVFTSGLTTADPATLALAKESRSLWKSYLDNFTARGGDDASKLMAKMAEIDVTPAEAARWIWGTSNVGAKGVSVRLAQKLRDTLPKEDWDAVRSGAWRMVAEAPPGKEFGPQAIANRIDAFTKGDGAAMARTLFSAEEIAQMQRLGRAMRLLVPPKEATQPSKTSYGIARLISDMWENAGAMMGFATGGLEGGLGAKLGGVAVRSGREALASRSIPAGAPQSVVNRSREALGGAMAGGAAAGIGGGQAQ